MGTVASKRAAQAPADAEFGPWLSQASILIVDDEPGMRNFLVRTLAPCCKQVEEAEDTAMASAKLNQNLVFIDTINDLVHREASLPEGSQGTATLFLEDVRVSTNVRLFEDRRALGTRVSAAVRERVLGQGQVWLDSAFVVNDWYISAYEPIVDSRGERVGMLYVGFLETPFQEEKLATLIAVLFGFVVVTAGSVPMFLRWARAACTADRGAAASGAAGFGKSKSGVRCSSIEMCNRSTEQRC